MKGQSQTRILIVDDEPALQYAYREILEHFDYQVFEASNAEAARQLANREPLDALLCDLSLEAGASGLEVIDACLREQPSMKCVLLTGYVDAPLRQAMAARKIPVLIKPVSIADLRRTLDQVLGTPMLQSSG